MVDWQTVAVALIVLAALLYTARRALARLRSLTSGGRGGDPACAAGCGKCGDEGVRVGRTGNALVHISPRKDLPRRRKS